MDVRELVEGQGIGIRCASKAGGRACPRVGLLEKLGVLDFHTRPVAQILRQLAVAPMLHTTHQQTAWLHPRVRPNSTPSPQAARQPYKCPALSLYPSLPCRGQPTSRRPISSGTPMSISRSKRPKRRSAASMELGRLVAAMTMTCARLLRPSMSVSS